MLDDLTELPEGWEVCTFGDIFDIKGGNQPPKSEFIDSPQSGYVRLLQIRDFESDKLAIYIKDDERLPKCSVDDLLIARYGASLGRICTGKSGSYNVALTKVIFDHDNLDRNWVKLFLESDWFQAPLFLVSRSAQNGFNKDELFPRSVPLPPLNEQKRIVAKIEELRSHTQAARNAIAHIPKLLEQFRQSVLAAAFRGDLTAEWRSENPDVESAEILLQHIRKSREIQHLEESKKSVIQGKRLSKLSCIETLKSSTSHSHSWVIISIESACSFIVDCLHSTPQFVADGEFCIDTTCIEPFRIIWEKARKVTAEDFKVRTSRMVPIGGDILFSREGTIGTTVKVPIDSRICLGQRMMMFRFPPEIIPDYAEMYLQSPIFKGLYQPMILGTTSPHLNIGEIRKLPFSVFPLAEQKEIVRQIKLAFAKIDRIEQQYQFTKTELDRLDRSILAKAFKGELVPQDPADEPAIVLLERIRNDRASQIKSIKIKRKKHSV